MNKSWVEFWQMGGYAQYVWPCYAVTLAAILYSTGSARRALRLALADARRASQDEESAP